MCSVLIKLGGDCTPLSCRYRYERYPFSICSAFELTVLDNYKLPLETYLSTREQMIRYAKL